MTKCIFIVGHMGAGKFLFTEALAKKLGWQIIDANPSIERYIGQQTRDILGEQGEAAFNHAQAQIIAQSRDKEHVIVLLEECVVSSEQCRKLLANEFVIYLKVSIATQLERMKNGRTSALPIDDMQSFLEQQHQERDTYYEEIASLVVESSGYSEQTAEINRIVAEDVDKVIKALRN